MFFYYIMTFFNVFTETIKTIAVILIIICAIKYLKKK